MKFCQLVSIYLMFLLPLGVVAQESDILYQLVTIHYDDAPLGYVLEDISANYGVNFTYSKDFIPVDQIVTAHVVDRRLEIALEEVFYTTQIVFGVIDDQIGLKIDKNKPIGLLSQVEEEDKWDGIPKILETPRININPFTPKNTTTAQKSDDPLDTNPDPILTTLETKIPPIEPEEIERDLPEEIFVANEEIPELIDEPIIEEEEMNQAGGDSYETPEIDFSEFEDLVLEKKEEIKGNFKGQISILPNFGTDAISKVEEKINNLSVNVLWGKNKGLNGLELGGLVNTIDEDVKGFQMAGIGNTVGGDMDGTQVGGWFNVNSGETKGVQFAGLVNHTQSTKAFQFAGLVNVTSGSFEGFQMATLVNVVEAGSTGTQLAGLINFSRLRAGSQYAGLINVADDVEHSQVAGLLNVAGTVKGNQFALINIADTVYGAPIGLLNFIEHGYNRVEIATYSNGLHATIGLKLGTQSFYNILQAGLRLDGFGNTNTGGNNPNTDIGKTPIWGIGYGLGTAITLNKRWLTNFEIVSSHINKNAFWTKELNLLNQVKLSMTLRLGRTSIFFGPNFNLMFSKVYDAENQIFGTPMSNKHLFETTNSNGLNTRAWIGFSGGVRF